MSRQAFISLRDYCRFDALGNETEDVRWLRLGRGRWHIEAGKWGVAVRLGAVSLSAHFDVPEDDDE